MNGFFRQNISAAPEIAYVYVKRREDPAMLTAEENDFLTQTGPDTPMGQYFRRFWQPVALSEELPERDGPPKKVTVMGEELVLFRDTEGRVGLLDRRCPHRGADLYYGRNEECGLRCVYHGWKFDVEGKGVDLANVPPGVRMHEEMRVLAYPTQEAGEMIWAYMGPPAEELPQGKLPELPDFEFIYMDPAKRYVTKQLMECNWAQAMEGDLDGAHFSFLHVPAPSVKANHHDFAPVDEKRLNWIRNDPIPRFDILEHEVGFVVGWERDADGESYWRMTQFSLPAAGTGPSTMPGETYYGFSLVPVDDISCWMYCYAWNPDRNLGNEEREKLATVGHGIIAEVDENYMPVRNRSNDYMIDREVQKNVSYTGVQGLAEQDIMVQQSQGFIADRTRETLTQTDGCVVKFRRMVMEDAKRLADGEEPEAPWRHQEYRRRPGGHFVPKGTPMEDVLMERFGHNRGAVI